MTKESISTNNFRDKTEKSKSTWKKLITLATLALALSGSPKQAQAIDTKKQEIKIELADNFSNWDEKKNKLRTKEEMTIDYISRNLYINGKSIKDTNAKIEKIAENLYSVEFEHEFLEWSKKIKMIFETRYENNGIFMKFQNHQISTDKWMKKFPTNTILEDKTTHNNYDTRVTPDTKTSNFTIKYNPYKTQNTIKNIVSKQEISSKQTFERIPEFENTQLTRLNNPTLWKYVFDEKSNTYHRELFYQDNLDYTKIVQIYFNENGEIDIQKTLENKKDLEILWIKVQYNIDDNWQFSILDESKQELIEKVRHDREILINMINSTKIASNKDFPWLNKIEYNDMRAPDSKIISLNPIKWIYEIQLNENHEKLHCKVEWESIILVDETGKTTNNTFYFNQWKNYYKLSINGWALSAQIINKAGENPHKILPNYSGDINAKNILNNKWLLTNINTNNIQYFDNNWYLIAQIPCKKENETFKMLDEYSTPLNMLDLYNYDWFKSITDNINWLCEQLWIVDIDIRKAFEKSLKEKGIDFNLKDIKISNPDSKKSIYYKISDNFDIKQDEKLYKTAKNCLETIKSRLEFIKMINNCQILRKNGKQIEDFEQFIWWESGIWKNFESQEDILKFLSGEINEINVKLIRWNWQSEIVNYSVIWNRLKALLTGQWSVYISDQRYNVKTDDRWNIIVEVKAEKK